MKGKIIVFILLFSTFLIANEIDTSKVKIDLSHCFFINTETNGKIAEWGTYDWVGKLQYDGEKWVFPAMLGTKYFWVNTETGQKIWGEYDDVENLEFAGSCYLFKALKKGKFAWINCKTENIQH